MFEENNRPFRALMEEELRDDLKSRINNKEFPLEWRVSCAHALGWQIIALGCNFVSILTHNNREFTIMGSWGV